MLLRVRSAPQRRAGSAPPGMARPRPRSLARDRAAGLRATGAASEVSRGDGNARARLSPKSLCTRARSRGTARPPRPRRCATPRPGGAPPKARAAPRPPGRGTPGLRSGADAAGPGTAGARPLRARRAGPPSTNSPLAYVAICTLQHHRGGKARKGSRQRRCLMIEPGPRSPEGLCRVPYPCLEPCSLARSMSCSLTGPGPRPWPVFGVQGRFRSWRRHRRSLCPTTMTIRDRAISGLVRRPEG